MRSLLRNPKVLVLGSALVVACIAGHIPPLSASPSSLPQVSTAPELVPAPPAAFRGAADPLQYVGAGSCAARACHGSPTLTRRGESNSAYTIWMANDPHAQAYAVLHTPESKQMAEGLTLGNAWEADRCLACHSLPISHAQAAAAKESELSALRADGVSCEACHGPAEKYLVAHTLNNWRKPGDRNFDPSFGMKNTADIAPRAQVCAGCHVGQPDPDGRPWRDVNHDLIAAGHPRLNFEFSAYMANLPPHWNTRANADRFDELRSWIVGQFTTADAALELLESRAKSAPSPKSAGER